MSDKDQPLISVLLCNYNYQAYVAEALESAIAQDYPNLEILVVDDGSTDDSVDAINFVIAKHPQANVRLQAKANNQGVCYARNDAIGLASGDYIVFLDGDDTMPPDYVSGLYKAISKADVAYGDVKRFGDETSVSDEPAYDPKRLLLDNYINISSLIKRSALGERRFDIALNRRSHEDYDFWLGLSLQGLRFVKANGQYLNYRIQNQSRNSNSVDMQARTLAFIDIWKYSIDKYKQQYWIDDDVTYRQLRYQIERIAGELSGLNDVVQTQLNPELTKRAEHIEHQQRLVEHHETVSGHLEAQLQSVLASKEYRLGSWLLHRARKVKRAIKR